MMNAEGLLVDGSWLLNIIVTDLIDGQDREKSIRVKGDLHIGGLMLKLVEMLSEVSMDWSDYGLWWPRKNMWLTRTRFTLDQYGVQADSDLVFMPMHKSLLVQLPDLQVKDLKVDFSKNVFNVVITLCKEFKIRHPEELSLARKLEREELKKNRGVQQPQRRSQGPQSPGGGGYQANGGGSPDGTLGGTLWRNSNTPTTPVGTLKRQSTGGSDTRNSPYNGGATTPVSMRSLAFDGATDGLLANSPEVSCSEALPTLYRPKTLAEKARINAGWLDSSRSLMEQGVKENDMVLLRFKFYNFYDLNPKYDSVRINQLYEQAKWALLSEELDCTEEEMMMFAALQVQIQRQAQQPQNDMNGSQGEDEIDAALNELQVSLEGSGVSSSSDITHVPKLEAELKFFKPKRFAFKSFKRYFFTFKDTQLTMYTSAQDLDKTPLMKVNLKGCEVTPDVNLSHGKYNIKLNVPSKDGMTEMWIRPENEEQYARWLAAFRLASKGRTMADSSYDGEVKTIHELLHMQHPNPAMALSPHEVVVMPENLLAPRFLKKLKSKQLLVQRILEAHAHVQDKSLTEAKMSYIKAWQALPEHGISYFIVKFKGAKKDELIGIASNRLIRMDLTNGHAVTTWRFSSMKTWRVNWEVLHLIVCFDDEEVSFQSLSADCKVIHEFIGGYIFLSMRSGEKNQSLNEEMFHKLTGGRS